MEQLDGHSFATAFTPLAGLTGAAATLGDTRISEQTLSAEVQAVLAAKGQAAMGSDQDDVVFVPLSTARNRLFGNQAGKQAQAYGQGGEVSHARLHDEGVLRDRRVGPLWAAAYALMSSASTSLAASCS